jgi:hypothetical protein
MQSCTPELVNLHVCDPASQLCTAGHDMAGRPAPHVPVVDCSARRVACSGSPYTCLEPGKVRSMDTACGPLGLLSSWPLKLSCHQPSGSPSYSAAGCVSSACHVSCCRCLCACACSVSICTLCTTSLTPFTSIMLGCMPEFVPNDRPNL